jgi:hypothetical protein
MLKIINVKKSGMMPPNLYTFKKALAVRCNNFIGKILKSCQVLPCPNLTNGYGTK